MLAAVAGLSLAAAVIIAIPGPSILYLVARALTHGRSSALRGVVGNALGTLTVGLILAVGLGAILTHFALFVVLLRYLGGIVLLALGVSYVRKAMRHDPTRPAGEGERFGKFKSPLLIGSIVGATNPKAAIIFGTVVPAFLPSGGEGVPVGLQLLILTPVPVLVGLVVDFLWVEAAHRARGWLARSSSSLRWLNAAGGLLMLAIAVFLIIEASTSLKP